MVDTPKGKDPNAAPLYGIREYGDSALPQVMSAQPRPYEYRYEIETDNAAPKNQHPPQAEQIINGLASQISTVGTNIQKGFHLTQNALVSRLGGNPDDYDPNALMNGLGAVAVSQYALTKGWTMADHKYSQIQVARETSAGFFEPREIMARQLLMRGHASVDEILHSSYGEWPPKGLDIVGKNDQRVRLTDIAGINHPDAKMSTWDRIKEMRTDFAGARATVSGERVIGVNHLSATLKPALLGTSNLGTYLGHEVTHSLQGDHFWRAKEVFDEHVAKEIWATQKDAASNLIAKDVFEQHTSSERMNSMHPEARAHIERASLTQGLEIQARMHQILSNGYQRWGTMPQNHEQLMVAMESVGVKPPSNVMADLEKSPTIAKTREIFSAGKHPEVYSHDINTAISTLTDAGKQEFWHKAAPSLYSDLIEMYGDKLGRERFGLGQNPWPERRMWAEITADLKKSELEKAAAALAPADRVPTGPKGEMHETKVSTGLKAGEIAGDVVHQARRVHGGLVTNVIVGAGAGIVTYALGKDLKESGKVSIQTMIPYSEAVMKAAEGDKKGAVHSAMTETAGLAGAISGAAGGAMAGAALGSVVPIIGTAIGGVAGGIIGGIAGGVGAGMGTEVLLNKVPAITEKVTAGVDAVMTKISGSGATTKTSGSPEPQKKINIIFAGASAPPVLSTGEIQQKQKELLHSSGLDHLERNGKVIDTEAALRDPAQRDRFIGGLEASAKTASNPDVKHNIEGMVKASRAYVELEDKRKTAPTSSDTTSAPVSATTVTPPKTTEILQNKAHAIQWQH